MPPRWKTFSRTTDKPHEKWIPVLVDVQPDTCNIDQKLIEAAITARTKAITPLYLHGQVAGMAESSPKTLMQAKIIDPDTERAARLFGTYLTSQEH